MGHAAALARTGILGTAADPARRDPALAPGVTGATVGDACEEQGENGGMFRGEYWALCQLDLCTYNNLCTSFYVYLALGDKSHGGSRVGADWGIWGWNPISCAGRLGYGWLWKWGVVAAV